jgi:hypothetical protein
MLEVMTRRYYQIRPLRNVQVTERRSRPLLTAEYAHDGDDYLIIATVADGAESAAGTELPQLLEALPSGRIVLVDLYVTSQTPEDEGDPGARADRIRGKLGLIPPAVARVAVAVRRADGTERGDPAWFTFRGGPDGVALEDPAQRGLHPMVAERLGLWRLSGFELTRLPAAPDVHLFRIQGRQVPDDQRLIALADVRDLTIVRDDRGWTPAWTAWARPGPPTASWPGWTGTGSSSTSGHPWTRRSPTSSRSSGHWHRAPGRWGSSRCWSSSAPWKLVLNPASWCCGCPARRERG